MEKAEKAALESICTLETQQNNIEGLLRSHRAALQRHKLLLERVVDRAANGSFKGSSAPNSPLDDFTGGVSLPLKAKTWGVKDTSPSRFSWASPSARGAETSTDGDSEDSETLLGRRTLLLQAQNSFRAFRTTMTSNLSTLIEDSVAKKQRIDPRNRVQKFLVPIVHSILFQLFVFVMIWTQVILITAQLNIMMQRALEGEFVDLEYRRENDLPVTDWEIHLSWLRRFEVLVLLVFAAEVLLRLLAEQWYFFTGHNAFWNVSDALISAVSLLYTMWDLSSADLSAKDQFRVVRILRCFRALNMIRIIKPFRRLRVILYSIMACLGSLMWALVLMFIMVLIASIYFEDVALLHIQLHTQNKHSIIKEDEVQEFTDLIREHWGCMFDSWLSLLYSVTGGVDWAGVALPFYMINPVHCLIYLGWVILITLGLVNITVGVFARQAQEYYQWDPHLIVEGAHSDHETTRQCLRELFRQMDISGNEVLSKREIAKGMEADLTKAYFAQLSIDIEMNPEEFFSLLDVDGDDRVDIDEFVQTCMRLQGGAKPLELQRIQNSLNVVRGQVMRLEEKLGEFQRPLEPWARAPFSTPDRRAVSPRATQLHGEGQLAD